EDAVLEDQAEPVVMVATKIRKGVAYAGKKVGTLATAMKLRPVLGVRDRDRHVVEILRLYDAESSKRVSVKDVRFITEGANGLHDDDELVLDGNLDVREDVLKLEASE